MGSAAGKQGGPMRPQQPQQQRPMGQQGKGPGLPMPQQPNMGGNRPYQPVGANNGPFNPNPVQPVNQQPQMPPQGKAPGQMPLGMQPGQLPQGITPQMLQQAQQGKGPQSPFNTPAQAGPAQVQNNNPGLMQ